MDYNKKKEQDTWDEDEPDCPNRWMLQGFVVNTGSDISSTANVSLRYNGDGMETVAFGMGPIDAAFHAIENLVQSGAQLASYTIHSMSRGVDAQGEVIVQLERDVQMMIPVYDFCLPDKECTSSGSSATDDPCELFRRIKFPVNEFFPPRLAELDCEETIS